MKKLFRTLFAAALCCLTFKATDACTNFIITRGASSDGSVMVSYAADSHQLYGALYKTFAGRYKPGTMLPVYDWDSGRYLGEIPQAAQTYATIGNMNEHSLIIAESTYGGREELADSTGRIDYGSLIYITRNAPRLPRSDPDHRGSGQHLRLRFERRILLDRRPERSLDHGADRQGLRARCRG